MLMEKFKLLKFKFIPFLFILIGIIDNTVMPINAAYFYDSASNQGQIISGFTGNWAQGPIYFETEIYDSDNIPYYIFNDTVTSNNPFRYPIDADYETLAHVYLDSNVPYINIENALITNLEIPVRLYSENAPLSRSQVAFGFRLQLFDADTNNLLPIEFINGLEYGEFTPRCTLTFKCLKLDNTYETRSIESTELVKLTSATQYSSGYVDFQIVIELPAEELIQYPFAYLTECIIPMFSYGTIVSDNNFSGVVLARSEVMIGRLSSEIINDGNRDPGEIGDIIIDFDDIPKIDLDGYDNELNSVLNKQEYQIYVSTIKSIFSNEIFTLILILSITFAIIGYVLYGRK